MIAFFLWEARLPVEKAAVFARSLVFHVKVCSPPMSYRPPCVWFYRNFSVLFSVALLPFFWWTVVYTIFVNLWQSFFRWTAVSAAAHMYVQHLFLQQPVSSMVRIPLGIMGFALSFTGGLGGIVSPKWVILLGQVMASAATATLALTGGNPDHYWPFVFPAFLIGTAGTMLVFTHTK